MTARREIRAALERAASELHRRFGVRVDVAMLRLLRDYGVECHELGVHHAHSRRTIPVPADDGVAPDELTGRYALPHPHAKDDDPDAQ